MPGIQKCVVFRGPEVLAAGLDSGVCFYSASLTTVQLGEFEGVGPVCSWVSDLGFRAARLY